MILSTRKSEDKIRLTALPKSFHRTTQRSSGYSHSNERSRPAKTVTVHNTSEVLFHLCANTDPQRDSIFTKGPSDVLDHAKSPAAANSAVKAKVEKLFGGIA